MFLFRAASPLWQSRMLSVLRIFAGALLFFHGTQKMFGYPPGQSGATPYVLLSLNGVAGILETFGGPLLVLGLLTRPVAFLLSGEMAVAYFKAHAPRGFLPIVNRGELAGILSIIYLYLVFAGAGVWSLDHLIARRRQKAAAPPA